MLDIKRFKVGLLRTNCYLVTDVETNKTAIVDPGGSLKELEDAVQRIGVNNIEYILLTHGHFDHILNAKSYRDLMNCKVVICREEADFTNDDNLNLSTEYLNGDLKHFDADILLNDMEYIMLGESKFTLMHTPGHTKGSSCYISDDVIFSGDTLMKGTIGRTDLLTSSYSDIIKSINKIKNLPGDYKIYPGHGFGTTLANERANNQYMGEIG